MSIEYKSIGCVARTRARENTPPFFFFQKKFLSPISPFQSKKLTQSPPTPPLATVPRSIREKSPENGYNKTACLFAVQTWRAGGSGPCWWPFSVLVFRVGFLLLFFLVAGPVSGVGLFVVVLVCFDFVVFGACGALRCVFLSWLVSYTILYPIVCPGALFLPFSCFGFVLSFWVGIVAFCFFLKSLCWT